MIFRVGLRSPGADSGDTMQNFPFRNSISIIATVAPAGATTGMGSWASTSICSIKTGAKRTKYTVYLSIVAGSNHKKTILVREGRNIHEARNLIPRGETFTEALCIVTHL
jgi:hypothetical protein